MNRVGEKNLNNFGSKMEIIACKKNNNIDVYFEEYNSLSFFENLERKSLLKAF